MSDERWISSWPTTFVIELRPWIILRKETIRSYFSLLFFSIIVVFHTQSVANTHTQSITTSFSFFFFPYPFRRAVPPINYIVFSPFPFVYNAPSSLSEYRFVVCDFFPPSTSRPNEPVNKFVKKVEPNRRERDFYKRIFSLVVVAVRYTIVPKRCFMPCVQRPKPHPSDRIQKKKKTET